MNLNKSKFIVFSIVILFVARTASSQSRFDSLKVFFKGEKPGERYRVIHNGKLLLEFKATKPYLHQFMYYPDSVEKNRDYITDLMVYRRSKFGLRYKDTGFYTKKESKKYLVIYRNPFFIKMKAVEPIWTDTVPSFYRKVN